MCQQEIKLLLFPEVALERVLIFLISYKAEHEHEHDKNIKNQKEGFNEV